MRRVFGYKSENDRRRKNQGNVVEERWVKKRGVPIFFFYGANLWQRAGGIDPSIPSKELHSSVRTYTANMRGDVSGHLVKGNSLAIILPLYPSDLKWKKVNYSLSNGDSL